MNVEAKSRRTFLTSVAAKLKGWIGKAPPNPPNCLRRCEFLSENWSYAVRAEKNESRNLTVYWSESILKSAHKINQLNYITTNVVDYNINMNIATFFSPNMSVEKKRWFLILSSCRLGIKLPNYIHKYIYFTKPTQLQAA